MKYTTIFVLSFLLLFGFVTDFKAQSPDTDVARLQKLVDIMGKINALKIDFKTASAEITPNSLIVLQKQAALLKQLPAGTIVEIGVHTFAVGSEPANQRVTQERADNIKNELIKFGVGASGLVAKGYGSSKPIAPNTTEESRAKNRRVEYLIEKTAPVGNSIAGTKNQLDKSTAAVIVAGRGSGKVVIGATREEVETALGTPEDYFKGNLILPNPSSHHRSKGVIVVYDAETNRAKEIDFVGNAAYLDAGSYRGPFTSFQGKPDKNLSWGASAAEVINAYAGAPKKRLVESRKGGEVVTLIYDQIVFTFYDDQLYYISVAENNNRLLGLKPSAAPVPTSTLKVPDSQSPSRRNSELESAETPRDIALLYNKYAREFQSLDTDFTQKVKIYSGLRQSTPVDKGSLCGLLAVIKPAYSNLMQALNRMVGVIESGKLDRVPDPKGNEEIKLKVANRRKNLLLLEDAIKTDSNNYGCRLN